MLEAYLVELWMLPSLLFDHFRKIHFAKFFEELLALSCCNFSIHTAFPILNSAECHVTRSSQSLWSLASLR